MSGVIEQHNPEPTTSMSRNRLTVVAVSDFLQNPDVKYWFALLVLIVLLLCVTIISLGTGAINIDARQVVYALINALGIDTGTEVNSVQQSVIESIRAPRVLLAILVGAGLAICGAAMQGLFRNPLADPALIGVSSGAALAAVTVIVLGSTVLSGYANTLGSYALPLAAFAGGFASTLLVYHFSSFNGRTIVSTMLLAGIAINVLAGAVTGLLTYIASDEQLRTLTFWSMGSLGGATWEELSVAAPLMLAGIVLIPLQSRALNAILLGESEAIHLGFHLEWVKKSLITLVALCVGTAVSISGIIGFIGLITPHLIRLSLGPDHRFLLPLSALLGATLLLLSDMLARTVVTPAELPIGIITSLIGGPFFLWLLARQRSRGRSW